MSVRGTQLRSVCTAAIYERARSTHSKAYIMCIYVRVYVFTEYAILDVFARQPSNLVVSYSRRLVSFSQRRGTRPVEIPLFVDSGHKRGNPPPPFASRPSLKRTFSGAFCDDGLEIMLKH